MKSYLLLLIFVVLGVQADIYRSVDNQGNVTFTDAPDTKAELIELEALPTYKALPVPMAAPIPSSVGAEDATNKSKYTISILSPEQNQNIWEGGGIFTAAASVQPELNEARGDQVQFKLDGKPVGGPQSSLSYTFNGIERGSHILAVSVVDINGRVLKTSKSVLFHMHRNSIIINKKQRPSPSP